MDTTAAPVDCGSFCKFISIGKLQSYQIRRLESPPDSMYYLESNETLSKGKFDLLLHKGHSKEGEILGVAKMHSRGFTIGIGDPAGELEGRPVIWERLERPEKYSHKTYHFDFGSAGQRATYTYRKTNGRTGRLKSMELRAGGVDEENGQLLAKWVGSSSWHMKDGTLFIAQGMEIGPSSDMPNGQNSNNWDIVVFLTAFSIIESQHRRSKG